MTTAHRLGTVLVLVLPALAAQAAGHIRPGLWEQTMAVKSDNPQADAAMAQMKERLAAMPPAQREAMEKAMAGRGVGVAPDGAPNTMRVCITREQAERDVTPDRGGHCQRSDVVRSGNTVRFSFACTMASTNVTGKGVFTRVSDSAYTVATDADMALHGTPSHIHTEVTGRFVASDCGDVKPVEAPPAR